jgi:hypothetical protein
MKLKSPKWFSMLWNRLPLRFRRRGDYGYYFAGDYLNAMNFIEFQGWFWVEKRDLVNCPILLRIFSFLLIEKS